MWSHGKSRPSTFWNEGPVKQSIIHFVKTVTDKANPLYVAPEDRIATFDNDGTLWLEQPIYTQAIFAFDRVKLLAAQHPEWTKQNPFSLILNGNKKALASLTVQDVERIIATTHTGMTVEAFHKIAQEWLATAINPRYHRLYTQLIYQPMLEAMNYLRNNGFKIYIVTGGGQDFVRAYSQPTYTVLPEQVIGSAGHTHYTYQSKKPVLIKLPAVLIIDDGAGKPEAINLFIGRKPIIALAIQMATGKC